MIKDLYFYTDRTGRATVLEFLRQADVKILDKFLYHAYIQLSSKHPLCEPHMKHFRIKQYRMFYEYRIQAAERIVRIISCRHGQKIVLLHAFYKACERDTECALAHALKLYKNIGESELVPMRGIYEVIQK